MYIYHKRVGLTGHLVIKFAHLFVKKPRRSYCYVYLFCLNLCKFFSKPNQSILNAYGIVLKRSFITLSIIGFIFILSGCNNPPPSNTADQVKPLDPMPDSNEKKDDVSKIISHQDASRAIWQKPELVISKLGNIENKTIADIGAGTGYFSFRILPKSKKVIAIDIDDDALVYMKTIAEQLPEPYQDKFETRKASPDNPNIKKDEVDILLLVNTYTYIANRVNYFSKLKKLLPIGAELIIIDFKKKKIPIGPEAADRIALSQVEIEIENAGYTLIESDDQSLNYQYIIHAINK